MSASPTTARTSSPTPPTGSPVRRGRHVGRDLASAVVDCAAYVDGHRTQAAPLSLADALAAARAAGGYTWIGLHAPDAPALQGVADQLGLPPLAVEDAVNAHQRPKLETYDDLLFMVLKTVRYLDHEELIETGELMLFLGPDFVVTVRHGDGSDLGDVRGALEADPQRLALGPVAVLHGVVDHVVDAYGPAAEAVEQDVDEIEEQVFSDTREQPTQRIYKLKREVLEFRRAVEPLGQATGALAHGGIECLDPRAAEYFRDVHDHVQRSTEIVQSLDALLDSALDANLAQVSVRQNDDMRRISAWVAIGAVDTLVAGVYGMNFQHMPELGWRYGYAYALVLMAVASLLLYRGFKRNDWL